MAHKFYATITKTLTYHVEIAADNLSDASKIANQHAAMAEETDGQEVDGLRLMRGRAESIVGLR